MNDYCENKHQQGNDTVMDATEIGSCHILFVGSKLYRRLCPLRNWDVSTQCIQMNNKRPSSRQK
jgi:hypothetical protein